MPELETISRVSRRLRDVLEPFSGQVYFSPECHAAYEKLGFGPSPHRSGDVDLPDGAAYFTSRGSLMGQVPGEVVAAAFGVFNPAVVKPAVTFGWGLTDAATICAMRTDGAVAQLERILGPEPEALPKVTDLLRRLTSDLSQPGRPLFSGVASQGSPGTALGEAWWLADQLREYRGDSHTIAWVGCGLDAIEIGLLSELWVGLPMGTYIRTRAWSPDELLAGRERLRARGLIDGEAFTPAGHELRAEVEEITDRQLAGVVEALGDDADELFTILVGWSRRIIDAGGYPKAGAAGLARQPD
ncbi:MAG: hypothetical protein NVSMB12_12620 [Acidimicrobiales bacterium]